MQRGDVIGTPITPEVFFGVDYNGQTFNPSQINRHFYFQNECDVRTQGRKLRFGPDMQQRDLSGGFFAGLLDGVRYFVRSVCSVPDYLINIDFNGIGSKTGLAATGFGASDYWNVYTPVTFTETGDGDCSYAYQSYSFVGVVYSVIPVLFLNDYRGIKTPVRLERVAPMDAADAGTTSTFDSMLTTWIGGVDGFSVPIETNLRLKGLPEGTYDIYLYSAGDSDFFVSKNRDTPGAESTNYAVSGAFVEGTNYSKFNLVLGGSDFVSIRALGKLSGLQVRRVE